MEIARFLPLADVPGHVVDDRFETVVTADDRGAFTDGLGVGVEDLQLHVAGGRVEANLGAPVDLP